MLTASIVLYKTPESQIDTIIKCVLEASCVSKLYIIDNSPTDYWDTSDYGAILEQKSDIITYIHHENTGYGASHNVAIKKAIESRSTYHVVLNPDLKFDPIVFSTLKSFMDSNQTIGQVMPKILNQEGELQYLCKLVPTPFDLLFKRFLPKVFSKKNAFRFQLKFTNYDKIMDVPYLSGCFMFFRIEALKEVNGFDERFFMYPEDIDITRRIHKNWRTVYYPDVFVYHLHAAESYHNKKMLLIHIQNIIKYFNKWGWLFDKERKQFNKETLDKLGYK